MVTGQGWLVVSGELEGRLAKIYAVGAGPGFVEILPCVYRSRWLEPELPKLRRALRHARRRGVGRIALARLDRKGLMMA